jgi:hypothetical protein
MESNLGTSSEHSAVFIGFGTLLGGTLGPVARLLASWWRRADRKTEREVDDAARMREELWTELRKLRADQATLRLELDEWKQKYFTLFVEHGQILERYNLLQREHNVLIEEQTALQAAYVDATGKLPPEGVHHV